LQAKVQLAGAMARRVRAEGAFEIAKNAYRSIFQKEVTSVDTMAAPLALTERSPPSVVEAIDQAMKNNPLLASSNLDALIAQEAVKQTFSSSYRPTIDGIIDYKLKEDVSATQGRQDELFTKIQINMPFNLGLTASNTLKATEFAQDAATYRYADAKTQIEERTRNAWQQLKTAKNNSVLLSNQANIAAEFLELARKERQLGRRSLLDVLSGEVALINAQSDALSAQIDVSVAIASLLDAMGDLSDTDLQ
jgi:adhesin transport system outer membrane protein